MSPPHQKVTLSDGVANNPPNAPLGTTANPLMAYDTQSAPATGVVQLTTAGQTYASGRLVEIDCTVSGGIILTFPDASTRTRTLYVGTQSFNYAVVSWALPGSGAASVSGVYNLM